MTLPPQLVEPVSSDGSEEMGVRKHHSADRWVNRPAVDVLSAACMADLRPGALEDGRKVDEILAEEESTADDKDQQHRNHPSDVKPRHFFVIRRLGCPELAHWRWWSGPWGIFHSSRPDCLSVQPGNVHGKFPWGCVVGSEEKLRVESRRMRQNETYKCPLECIGVIMHGKAARRWLSQRFSATNG